MIVLAKRQTGGLSPGRHFSARVRRSRPRRLLLADVRRAEASIAGKLDARW
jgi:hypothetical protein